MENRHNAASKVKNLLIMLKIPLPAGIKRVKIRYLYSAFCHG